MLLDVAAFEIEHLRIAVLVVALTSRCSFFLPVEDHFDVPQGRSRGDEQEESL